MITLERYSQRDSRWSQQKLGTSTLTIGDYGCAITCIAMMARVRPDKVNNIMVSSGAFHQNALVKWAPVSGLFGLSFQTQGEYYPRIAEVSGLSGFAQHFVLVMNKDILWDPWDGKEKTWGNSGYSFKSWRHLRIIEKVVLNETPMTIQDARILIEDISKERARTDSITDKRQNMFVDVEVYAQRYLNEPAKRPILQELYQNIDDILEKQGFTHYELKSHAYRKGYDDKTKLTLEVLRDAEKVIKEGIDKVK